MAGGPAGAEPDAGPPALQAILSAGRRRGRASSPAPAISPGANSWRRGPSCREGIGCRAGGAAHGARRAGPVPGRPAANPHRGCRLRAPSRSTDPRRSHGVASRSRSAHAARAPRTAALGGSPEVAVIPPCRASRALATDRAKAQRFAFARSSAHNHALPIPVRV